MTQSLKERPVCGSARAVRRWRWPRPGDQGPLGHGDGLDGADRDQGHPHHGRRVQDRPLAEAGGKGLFTKEIEEALLGGQHRSCRALPKDMPTILPPGLVIAGFLAREDVRDALIGRKAATLATGAGRGGRHRLATPPGACQETTAGSHGSCCAAMSRRGFASSRRERSDATLLAVAGLKRLGLWRRRRILDPETSCRPSARARSVSRRGGRRCQTAHLWQRSTMRIQRSPSLPNAPSWRCWTALAARRSAAMPNSIQGTLRFHGIIIKPDGSEAFEVLREGAREAAAELGADAGGELRARAGADFFVRA